jgi:hypothetical protein
MQKLNQGKENKQLKLPSSQSRTYLHSSYWNNEGKKKGQKLDSSKKKKKKGGFSGK